MGQLYLMLKTAAPPYETIGAALETPMGVPPAPRLTHMQRLRARLMHELARIRSNYHNVINNAHFNQQAVNDLARQMGRYTGRSWRFARNAASDMASKIKDMADQAAEARRARAAADTSRFMSNAAAGVIRPSQDMLNTLRRVVAAPAPPPVQSVVKEVQQATTKSHNPWAMLGAGALLAMLLNNRRTY